MSEDTATTQAPPSDEAAPDQARQTGDQQAAAYDWQSPCRFTHHQIDEIGVFTKLVCRRISQSLTTMFHIDMQIQSDPLTQHFGFRLTEQSLEQPEYWASIKDAASDQRVGYISFAKENAGRWVAGLLGSLATNVSGGQTLSSLEQDLLYDITSNMAQTFSDAMERACGRRIEAIEDENFGELDFREPEVIDAFCKLTFTTAGEDVMATSFVISSDFLGRVVGINAPAKPDDPSITTISNAAPATIKRHRMCLIGAFLHLLGSVVSAFPACEPV